ncbi:MAG: hypothetical protein HN348_23580, partial [Proteobacteria bacterium]|nr:hypothetical protein [Pseudomonadota bacterium]
QVENNNAQRQIDVFWNVGSWGDGFILVDGVEVKRWEHRFAGKYPGVKHGFPLDSSTAFVQKRLIDFVLVIDGQQVGNEKLILDEPTDGIERHALMLVVVLALAMVGLSLLATLLGILALAWS